MKEENSEPEKCECYKEKEFHKNHHVGGCGSGAIYGLGVIGALFYFLQNVIGFVPILMGIGKAIFWPALLIFRLFTDLKI